MGLFFEKHEKYVIFVKAKHRPMQNFRLDRNHIAIFELGKEPKNYLFWLEQSVEKRLAALEFYRQQYHQGYGTQSRLQRVYTIIERKTS